MLIPKANHWLSVNADLKLLKCETVERKSADLEFVYSQNVLFRPEKPSANNSSSSNKNNNINSNNNNNINNIYNCSNNTSSNTTVNTTVNFNSLPNHAINLAHHAKTLRVFCVKGLRSYLDLSGSFLYLSWILPRSSLDPPWVLHWRG
ncbi:hypothetical protein HELRODRAFT_178550 [Helobdella robusta]|uniref:Uncharacterized protein n=1 Tax=Helobdella robusta TaxID=6412 RepID=T1FDC8_HELRO|nr:hypothetical protein HELRODRAFT_178550 [Helobdella robusta]ESN97099.1 hypothetical protein HELRODRAFT_178550 [Helobdella robusta]